MTTHQDRLIVIIEDDEDYAQSIVDCLEWQGFTFVIATAGTDGLTAVKARSPDLVILDLRLSTKLEGLSVLRQLRADPATADIPVIIHSVRADEKELRTSGIKLGAWYCLDKHDRLAELEAIVHRALDIRYRGHIPAKRQRLVPVDYDKQAGTVWINGQAADIRLSHHQAKLLAFLVKRAGQICSRDEIAEEVYETPNVTNQQIDRLVGRLRVKLRDDTDYPRYIEAIYGVGYKLHVDQQKA
jgi:DNA-binding response OmpR family regulator